MENNNGRGQQGFPQHYNHFNIPFPSNVQYLSNSVPMPRVAYEENAFYPVQPQPFNMSPEGLNYPRHHNIIHNNYFMQNTSHRDVRPIIQNNSNRFINPFQQQIARNSSEASYNKANQTSIRDSIPKAVKPIELQVSAKPFVPESTIKSNKIEVAVGNGCEKLDPVSKPLQDFEPPVGSVVKSNTFNDFSNLCADSTRPRDSPRDKRDFRKGFSTSSNKSFPSRENNAGRRNHFPNTQIWTRTDTSNYYQPANDQYDTQLGGQNNPRINKYQNRSKFSNSEMACNDSYYSRNRGQEKQNYSKKSEWKKPNIRDNDPRYISGPRMPDYGDYNGFGRQDVNNFGKVRQNNTYPNENTKDFGYNNRKYKNVHENNYNERFDNKMQKMRYNRPNTFKDYNTVPPANHRTFTKNGSVTSYNDRASKSNNANKQYEERYSPRSTSAATNEIATDKSVGREIAAGAKIIVKENEKMQRETMTDLLSQGLYECMVCCERIKQQHAIWSCHKCYNCFHLGCTKKWAGTSQGGETGWRCPACQNLNPKMPSGYFCFCKKLREPEWNRRETAHSCGEVCGKKREKEWCTHKCTNLCHPGPCPDCSAFIKRQCCCGKNSKEVRCSNGEQYTCEAICGLPLNCGVHLCESICHIGSCATCSVTVDEECFCGKEKRTILCTKETGNEAVFSCGATCNRTLSCSNHSCEQTCHSAPCEPCKMAVETILTCPCGKMQLSDFFGKKEGRSSCTDPIPTCSGICGKVLKCGTPGSYHVCQVLCHEGPCPPCQDQTSVKCRCGFMDKKIPCLELLTKADEITCEKQCKKLRQCGRHKCGTKCCIDVDHLCTRICGRTLKCRLHKCQEACHRGNCSRCWETSFEELSCHCGAAVTYPPIPCGTEPPPCNLPCRRPQPCTHRVSHTCHADSKCPPCTTLVSKPCFGNHMMMKSTPCYVTAMSCGEQCAKKLPCNLHLCQKVCHEGKCVQGSNCPQKCSERRSSCEHSCGSPCHSGPCPDTPCREIVTVTCACGNRKSEMVCSENDKEYKSVATSKLASMMHNLTTGGSVDLSQIFSGVNNRPEKFERLECNDDCGLLARNRRLALALQITNPDSREALGDQSSLFSDSVKEEARRDMQFAFMVHNALNDLVLKARDSKQKNRSHSFAPMNREKRKFIHEYSKYFGCQSQSYDEEPKKNVVVTACKVMSRLPPMSVVAVIQKELGQRKVPGPVLTRKILAGEENSCQMKKLEKSNSFEKKDSNPLSSSQGTSKNPPPPPIDYFDLS